MSGHRTATEAQKALLLLLGHIRQPPSLNGAHAGHPALGHALNCPPQANWQPPSFVPAEASSALKSKPEFL